MTFHLSSNAFHSPSIALPPPKMGCSNDVPTMFHRHSSGLPTPSNDGCSNPPGPPQRAHAHVRAVCGPVLAARKVGGTGECFDLVPMPGLPARWGVGGLPVPFSLPKIRGAENDL